MLCVCSDCSCQSAHIGHGARWLRVFWLEIEGFSSYCICAKKTQIKYIACISSGARCLYQHTYFVWEPDKTSRDKTSHAIFLHPGQNIPQRFATPDKTPHAVFVTPDITSHTIFVTPDITSHAIFATLDKTSHTQTASSR